MGRITRNDISVLVAGVATIALLVRVFLWTPDVTETTVALVLLLVVLSAAALGRIIVAMVIAVAATLALNFFFLPPLGTLSIAEPQNWVALGAFLVVAVIASNLSAAARGRATEAIARRNEVTRLFDLTRDVVLTTETTGAIEALARHVARRFELSRVAICLPGDSGWRVIQGGDASVNIDPATLDTVLARARGRLEFDARQRTYGGHATIDAGDQTFSVVPLRQGTKVVGVLAAVAPTLDAGSLDALAGVVAIAIERAQFLSEREAAELVRQKGELAATLLASLSHDLKTPLTAIRMAVENLSAGLPDVERTAQARVALFELDRLHRLFQDILDMARVDAAAIQVDSEWVTPADIVDAAAAYARHALDGRQLRIEADGGQEVQIDPRLASAALAHLMENAAQYSPVNGDIVIQASAGDEGLSVSVTDHGPGLDPGELEHLFERFYRGRAARLASSGTGMGLAITRGLLSTAGGRVWAENAPGAGARFSMRVPGPVRRASLAE